MIERNERKVMVMKTAMHRRAYGVTQATIAAEVGVSQVSISKWERGEVVPNMPMLTKYVLAVYSKIRRPICSEAPNANCA